MANDQAKTNLQLGKIKKVFPGGNTSQGFFSFYDYIITPDTTRIFIIKGGPGVGKSTFMRKIGDEMVARGFDVEYHHCSSDNSSLDGVVIPSIGIAFIDGTAPHIVDPKNPGCVDEIIHLGDYWDEEEMRKYKDEIIDLNQQVNRHFKSAYRYLKAAQAVYDDWERANIEAIDYGKANKMSADVIGEIFINGVVDKIGLVRHLFASAITPDGIVNYLETIIGDCKEKYVVEGDPGTGKSTLLQKVAEAAKERGYDVEVYHCALNPNKVEHVVIPQLSVALTKSIEPHAYLARGKDKVIDMNRCLDPGVIKRNEHLVRKAEEHFKRLFAEAVEYIRLAKEAHDKMEEYYVDNMDFTAIANLRNKVLQRVLGYAREQGIKVS